jgi:hypothetical protein
MNLSAPKQNTFYIAAVLWLLGLLGNFIPTVDQIFGMMADGGGAYWLAILGGLVLIIGNAMDGM